MNQSRLKEFCIASAVILLSAGGCRPHQAAQAAQAARSSICFVEAAAKKDTAKAIDCIEPILAEVWGSPEEPATEPIERRSSEQRRALARSILPCMSQEIQAGTPERKAVAMCVGRMPTPTLDGDFTRKHSSALATVTGPSPSLSAPLVASRPEAELFIEYRKMSRLTLRKPNGESFAKDLRTNPTKWSPSPPPSGWLADFAEVSLRVVVVDEPTTVSFCGGSLGEYLALAPLTPDHRLSSDGRMFRLAALKLDPAPSSNVSCQPSGAGIDIVRDSF